MLWVETLVKPYKRQQKKRRAALYLRPLSRRAWSRPIACLPTVHGDAGANPVVALGNSPPAKTRPGQGSGQRWGETPGAAEPHTLGVEEQLINRNLAASATGLGLAAAGMFLYWPLALVSVPFTLYASVDVLREAKLALLKSVVYVILCWTRPVI